MISEFFSLFFLFIISFSIYNHINASYKVGFIIVSRANPCIYTYLVDFLFPMGLGTCIYIIDNIWFSNSISARDDDEDGRIRRGRKWDLRQWDHRGFSAAKDWRRSSGDSGIDSGIGGGVVHSRAMAPSADSPSHP